MANLENHIFSTNSRVIRELFTQYKNTFYAFKELINNSIQAGSTAIDIKIDYAKSELTKSPIKSIVITDNGYGVALKDLDKKILEIGTDVKKGGQGVGRFAALQIGAKMEIESLAYDESIKKYTKINLPINSASFDNKKTRELKFPTHEEILDGKHNPYYKVSISSLHHNKNEKTDRKNIIAKELLEENINLALFEQYPYEIFNDSVSFVVNNYKLNRNDFIYSTPVHKKELFTDIRGDTHEFEFFFYNVKLNSHKAKVFFQIDNSGIKSVANSYTYSSEWLNQEMGSWFIYVESPLFSYDLFRSIDMDELGDQGIDLIKTFVKDVVTEYFISINKKYENFTRKLHDSYPILFDSKNAPSETHKLLFEQFAFILEQQYKLLEKDHKIKDVIFPLMGKAISDGNLIEILDSLLKSDNDTTKKFRKLLDSTDIENVVHFTSSVAEKIEFLDFLHEITYGEISSYILERKQLHKIVERELWLFGESYSNTPNMLWSDKRISGIFDGLREKYMTYEPSMDDENLIELSGDGLNDITDLFFTNEKRLDNGGMEYMIVELKAPKCKISQKELAQIKKYAYTIESTAGIPKHNAKYKLLLVSSDITPQAKSEIRSLSAAYDVPFLIERKKDADIEIYVITWSELIGMQRNKLNYLSNQLRIKDKSVKEKFEEEYPSLITQKMSTRLIKIS